MFIQDSTLSSQIESTQQTVYKTQSGNSFVSLAQKFLGNPGNFREIADLNGLDIFKQFPTGQTLQIPSVEQASQMVLEYINKQNQDNPASAENLLKASDLDLSGLRKANSQFGVAEWQLIQWISN